MKDSADGTAGTDASSTRTGTSARMRQPDAAR
jgi:hypothetical protein